MDNSRIIPDTFLVSRCTFFATFIYNVKAEEVASFKENGTQATYTITAFSSGVLTVHKAVSGNVHTPFYNKWFINSCS